MNLSDGFLLSVWIGGYIFILEELPKKSKWYKRVGYFFMTPIFIGIAIMENMKKERG